MDIPHWTEVPDHFVWRAFDWASSNSDGSFADPGSAKHASDRLRRTRNLGPEAAQQEALLAETEYFYVVPDQFGVVSGHVLILPKEQQTSIACIDPSFDDEITWLIECVSKVVATEYNAQVVVAEHGECGCTTASQAHIHVLPIPRRVTPAELRAIIDDVLRRRMVGIDRITYRDTEFTALDDLHSLIDVDGADITGRQLKCSDLINDGTYPAAARTASGLIRPYVYFAGPGVRFVSTRSFRSQFVREVVSMATSRPPGAWDRRVHTDRSNMFDTFARLAPVFSRCDDAMHEFKPRGLATDQGHPDKALTIGV